MKSPSGFIVAQSQEDAGSDAGRRKKFNELYIPPSAMRLRRVVRERLMLQYYKTKKFPLKNAPTKKRAIETVNGFKKRRPDGKQGLHARDVQKRIKENSRSTRYVTNSANFLDYPRVRRFRSTTRRTSRAISAKPASKYGHPHRSLRYQQADQQADCEFQRVRGSLELREEIVNFQGDFEQVAKLTTTMKNLRGRGGMIILNPKTRLRADVTTRTRQRHPKLQKKEVIRSLNSADQLVRSRNSSTARSRASAA